MKTCTKCGAEKALDLFHRRALSSDGLNARCKVCCSADSAAWRAANHSRTLLVGRAWKAANRERHRAAGRAYAANNKARAATTSRRHYERNKDAKAARQQAWRQANPERGRSYTASYRARRQAAFVEYVDPLMLLELDDGVCGICGRDVDPAVFEVDHIVPLLRGGEHSYANTQVAHMVCNRSKGAGLPW